MRRSSAVAAALERGPILSTRKAVVRVAAGSRESLAARRGRSVDADFAEELGRVASARSPRRLVRHSQVLEHETDDHRLGNLAEDT